MQQVFTPPVPVLPHAPGPRRRHWARVVQFSDNVALLERLDRVSADADAATSLVELLCAIEVVPIPRLRFHARRSPFTGACERPRSMWVALLGEEELTWREANGWGRVPDEGAIRLGRTTTVMTLAHELAHHVVFHVDAPSTPAHGRVWVARFDRTASSLARLVLPRV